MSVETIQLAQTFPGYIEQPGEIIVANGGGSGSATVVEDINRLAVQSELVVGTAGCDDGGGNSLTREIGGGQLPVSDLRRNVIAVANAEPDASGDVHPQRYKAIHAAGAALNSRIPKHVDKQAPYPAEDIPHAWNTYEAEKATFSVALHAARPRTTSKAALKEVLHQADRAVGMLDRMPGGHTLGSLALAGLTEKHGIETALGDFGALLGVRDDVAVMPVTLEQHRLGRISGGVAMIGEHQIDELPPIDPYNTRTWLTSSPTINPAFAAKLGKANMLVTTPGSYYTSILPSLLADGTIGAIKEMKANGGVWGVVGNNDVNPNDGTTWGAGDFVADMRRQLGGIAPDFLIYNTGKLPETMQPLPPAIEALEGLGIMAIGANLVGTRRAANPHEAIRRGEIMTNGAEVVHTLRTHLPHIRAYVRQRDAERAQRAAELRRVPVSTRG